MLKSSSSLVLNSGTVSTSNVSEVIEEGQVNSAYSQVHAGVPEKRRHTFFHLNSSAGNHHHIGQFRSASHLNLPTFTFNGSVIHDWKLHFGAFIRKHSNSTLHQSGSMQSLCYETLKKFIQNDQILELSGFLSRGQGQIQVDDHDENGSTALIIACRTGKLPFVKELLKFGADLNYQDQDGWTPLMCASKEGFVEVTKVLLEKEANLELRDIGGWTSLLWASYKGHVEVVELLVELGAEVNVYGNLHISPLIWAAGRGYTRIVEILINNGAKVNFGDKYGTTPMIWACRKGYVEIVDMLLKALANVDATGMYCWTPLILATTGNFVDVVHLLLEHKPNVNAVDRDGCTALTIACKEGFHEIVLALIGAGAYINLQDRSGETNLIHAVKGGHKNVVETLLKKYADVNIHGKERKTPLYVAVEKQNVAIVKLLLNANPDLEITTKTGDTALLRAVRVKNAEILHLLLEKKAKVSAVDKNGDTILHIAMRARSKTIVELILRNPKNSVLLYRPNKQGETPYNFDLNSQKPILSQVFGARRLNTNEDNENMLGYDLYNSALADILSEPSLSMPITVGLYAKWGSGKSFLLGKLKDEMSNFARQWRQPVFEFSLILFLIITHITIIIGTHVGALIPDLRIGLLVTGLLFVCIYTILITLWYFSQRLDCNLPADIIGWLAKKLNSAQLIFQIVFYHPPASAMSFDHVQPVRFYFTDQARVSSSVGGENTLVHMIGSLYDAIERDCGHLATRLYRALRPKMSRETLTQRWRKICCVPYFLLFELGFICAEIASILTILYFVHYDVFKSDLLTIQAVLVTVVVILVAIFLTNIGTWLKIIGAILFSHRRHLQRSIAQLESLKSEGFVNIIKREVSLMTDMVKCLDGLRNRQSRLVVIVDGLDSCEQDKVLLMLDAVHMMFSDRNKPFIIVLAIDPHIISKVVEMGSHRLFNENNISGYDYLHNLVHLPFYLQNSGLRKSKLAQQTANALMKKIDFDDNHLVRSQSNRRLSSESCPISSSSEKLKIVPMSRKSSTKLKLSESLTSSIGSNLNRLNGANDLTRMLMTDDYFSDVNPKSMRRLMNVVYVTGRLMKAFHIDFNWCRLASWINITEQWPYRTTWIILHFDINEDTLDDSMSLKAIYDLVKPMIPVTKETEPLLELDRDEHKFDVFLSFHRASLLVSDLKIFLPFTINLDPYIKKIAKNQYQHLVDEEAMFLTQTRLNWNPTYFNSDKDRASKRKRSPVGAFMSVRSHMEGYPVSVFSNEILNIKLEELNIDGVTNLLRKCEGLSRDNIDRYAEIVKFHNISGRVLLHCSLDDLKAVLNMNFGDWELFKMMIASLREHEMTTICKKNERNFKVDDFKRKLSSNTDKKVGAGRNHSNKDIKHVPNNTSSNSLQSSCGGSSRSLNVSNHAVIEKQITLEEQAICGTLQTLNEEAFEDVRDGGVVVDVSDADVVLLPNSETNPISDSLWLSYRFLFILVHVVIVSAIIKPGYLDFDNLPDTNFSCIGKVIGGYYADVETSCQMFHVCTVGPLDEPMDIRFLCLNGTVFDQETRVCERVEEVDCSKTEKFYNLNLELYGNVQEEGHNENIIKSAPTTTTVRTTTPTTTTTTTTTTSTTTTTTSTTTPKPQVTTVLRPYVLSSLEPSIVFSNIGQYFNLNRRDSGLKSSSLTNLSTLSSSLLPPRSQSPSVPSTEKPAAFYYGLSSTISSDYDENRSSQPISYQNQNFYKPIVYLTPTTERPTLSTSVTTSVLPKSSPSPFSRRTTPFNFGSRLDFDPYHRFPVKRNEVPRIIVNVDATVRDSNGRQLNYTVGTIVPSRGRVVVPTADGSFGLTDNRGRSFSAFRSRFNDDHYDDDTPFYYDVPKIHLKVQNRRFRRRSFDIGGNSSVIFAK